MPVRLKRCAILGGVAMASLMAASSVFGQGAYYPVNPPGPPYGATYTGITVASNYYLQQLQQTLQSLYSTTVTLSVPIPAGSSSPTTPQYSATVTQVVTNVLNGSIPGAPGDSNPPVSLANEAIAWRLDDRISTATAIAQAIIQYDYSTSGNATQAITDLTKITQGLGIAQPTTIDTIIPSILEQASATGSIAAGIPQIAMAAVNTIPNDPTRIASITGSAIVAIGNSGLSSADQTNLFTGSSGLVFQLMQSAAANNNPAVIAAIAQSVTSAGFSGLASLNQVLDAVVGAMPIKSNRTMGAVADGALVSQPSNAGTIQSTLASANVATAPYTNAIVNGFSDTSSSSAFTTAVTGNPGYVDAVAQGATVKGSLTPVTIVQIALTNSGSTTPRNIVAAVVDANLGAAIDTVAGAINTSTHAPYGSPAVTFGDLAWGAADAAPIQSVGGAIQAILFNVSSSNFTATVPSVVDNAIQGAFAGNQTGAFAAIIYDAELVARATSGASAPLVKQAIDSLHAVTLAGGPDNSYLGMVAALAGDTNGGNYTAIKNQGDSELAATGGDQVAADGAATLIQNLHAGTSKTFASTITAFNTASTTSTNSVSADLYAAILVNPNEEADAALASAIKQTGVSDATLLGVADDAYRVSMENFSLAPSLAMVDAVVTHLKSEATAPGGSIQDLFDFVGHQIVINSSLTKDIAIAATVIDPNHAHFVAHAVAFNASTESNPTGASSSIASIFEYAQIANTAPFALPSAGNPTGATDAILDQTAAAAAITAGLTTGILEANLTSASTQSALSTIISAVGASITQDGRYLQGMTNPFNAAGDTSKQFQQSNGTAWNGTNPSSGAPTPGAAGPITGYIAEVTQINDNTISAQTGAVLEASVSGGARYYTLPIAQAAGQAFAWVSQYNATPVVDATVGNPVYDIANAMAPNVVPDFVSFPQLQNAVAFGISQAQQGVIGAGALGLNAGTLTCQATGNANENFYLHRSAAGTPAPDIFTLNSAFSTPTGVDIGVRIQGPAAVYSIAVEPLGTLTSPLRIRKGGVTTGILLVDPNSSSASPIRIQTPWGIKALKKLP